ncbi:MAG TPA: hypothetical protein VGY56_14095 [Verrucomicrobiae bacterium]|nr:hypothetical protein [Verrucomicrobiae bacterium]
MLKVIDGFLEVIAGCALFLPLEFRLVALLAGLLMEDCRKTRRILLPLIWLSFVIGFLSIQNSLPPSIH